MNASRRRVRMMVAAVAALSIGSALAADGTWIKRDGVGTGGTNWADWHDPANWEGGIVADGYGKASLAGAENQYISITNSVSVDNLNGSSTGYAVLRSDETVQIKTEDWSTGPRFVWLYAPYSMYTKSGTNFGGLNTLEVCGPAVEQLNGDLMSRGTTEFRFDCFAETSDGVRTVKAVPSALRPDAKSTMRFIAPHGSDTNSVSAWSQTEGSAFLSPVDGPVAHTLSAGTDVTGAGIPAGTFLKRIFPDGTIELSAAATATVSENALTFAAFTADVTVDPVGFVAYNGTGMRYVNVEKYRAEDELTVSGILSFYMAQVRSTYTIDTREGYYPGVLRLTADSTYSEVTLNRARIAFAGDQSGKHFFVESDVFAPEFIVAEGESVAVGGLDRLKGTLVKKGAGKLTLDFQATSAADMSGNLTVDEGTLSVRIADGAVRSVNTLTVRAGARFDVPQGGFDCTTLVCEKGATIGGFGQLRCANVSQETLANVTITDAVYITSGTPTGDLKLEFNGSYVPGTATEDDHVIFVIESNTTLRVAGSGRVDVMIVGGGGGGGVTRGGGGGGGGVIITNALEISEGLYGVAVGAGGTAGVWGSTAAVRQMGGNGGDSSAFGLVAVGGGGGGTRGLSADSGSAGGSGGGASGPYFYNGTSFSLGGAGVEGQGYAGGMSTNRNTSAQGGTRADSAGGGGGGAGEPGHNAPALTVPGDGGDGIECPFWRNHWFAGGGGGGSGGENVSAGGKGGGGAGGRSSVYDPAGDGGYATGGGGGGGGCKGDESATGQSGKGGSGVVLLRVPCSMLIDKSKIPAAPVATGGDIRRSKGYAIHTFTQDDTFELSEDILADVLVVGGGGGGGSQAGGGGGGGGVVIVSNWYFRAGSYPIAVGLGGSGGSNSPGETGGASSVKNPWSKLMSLTALGGGGGGQRAKSPTAGGSGGGAGAKYYALEVPCRTDGAAGTDGQGFGGGASTNDTKVGTKSGKWAVSGGGGGGGAGEPGADATAGCGGAGGDGVFCGFSGAEVCYGGGGGGGSTQVIQEPFYLAAGGAGGGGRGGSAKHVDSSRNGGTPGEDGVDGLGGGGGSGLAAEYYDRGGNGGSGLVIIRYHVQPSGLMLIFR